MVNERFWSKVDTSGDCWQWIGAKNAKGYGNFYASRSKWVHAHRFSWEVANGSIPDGMHVLHHCDNPSCVRPLHLFLGTNLDNRRDMFAKRRHPHGQTHGNSKLTMNDARAIRALCNRGDTRASLARSFKVSRSTVRDIVIGASYVDAP